MKKILGAVSYYQTYLDEVLQWVGTQEVGALEDRVGALEDRSPQETNSEPEPYIWLEPLRFVSLN